MPLYLSAGSVSALTVKLQLPGGAGAASLLLDFIIELIIIIMIGPDSVQAAGAG